MTDESSTNDGTDAQHPIQHAGVDGTADERARSTGLGRRGFLKTTAAGVAAATGLTAATATASAEQSRVKVTSMGSGRQYYEIHMEGSSLSSEEPNIQCAEDCEVNDTVQVEETGVGRYLDHKVASGYVWGTGDDYFTYTGEIDYVVVKGEVAFLFDDRAFLSDWEDGGNVYVDGLGNGRHEYVLATYSGDIDSYENEPGDEDVGGADSEKPDTFDQFNGDVWDYKRDSLSLSHGPMRYVQVEGHARVWVRFES